MDSVLRVLGTPALRHPTRWAPLPLDLRTALVGVLAHGGGSTSRERLAALFWPESDGRIARQNLRQVVLRARTVVGSDVIQGDAAALRVTIASDIDALRSALDRRDAITAAQLGLAPLLEGLEHLPNLEWQAWLDLERRALEEQIRRLLLEAAADWAQKSPPAGAVSALATWVDRDPFDDDLHAAYLHCARLVPGEAAAAAARLSRIAALLDFEVGNGVAESVVLASTWLSDDGAPVASTTTAEVFRESGRGGALPFVGRQAEIEALDAAVLDPAIALVTIHGPGGIGKTRLARAWAQRFGHGVQVIPLAGAAGIDDAARRIVAGHGWRLGDAVDAQVVAELLSRSVPSVVLDEVEGLPWLPELLAALARARGLTVVATSRDRTGVEGEHLLRLGGLVWEGEGPALRLFRRAAARVRGTTDWDEEDRHALARFAARVEGSPLALVLAAGWLQLGTPASVLESLLNDDDDPLSFGEVLEPSWRRLSATASAALQALSVFPEHFDVEGALEVARCDRRTLRSLVDAALVEPGTRAGLRLHPLVRLDAARRLARAPETASSVRRRHAEHVARTLGDRAGALYGGPRQLQVHAAIGARIADLEHAWAHACETSAIFLLDRLLDCVWSFEIRGWYRLGETFTATAVDALERAAPEPRARLPLARALARQRIFAMRAGDVGRTRATARRADALFAAEGVDPDPFVLFHLGIADWLEGDAAGAERWHHELLALARRTGNVWAESGALANLGQFEIERGRVEDGLASLRASIELLESNGDRWAAALVHLNLAWQLHLGGDADATIRRHLDGALAAAVQLDMRHSEAVGQVLLHDHLRRIGALEAAHVALERARALVAEGALAELDARDAEVRHVHETLAAHPTGVTWTVTAASRPDA